MSHRHHAHGVVNLHALGISNSIIHVRNMSIFKSAHQIQEKRVSAVARSIMHSVARNIGECIWRSDDKVNLGIFPPLNPSFLVCLSLGNYLPILIDDLGVPVVQEV